MVALLILATVLSQLGAEPAGPAGPEVIVPRVTPDRPPQPVMEAVLRPLPPVREEVAASSATSGRPAGTNWLQIPALGVSAGFGTSGCTGDTANAIGAGLYRVVCHDIHSTYLASHNWSTLHALQQAYRGGRLALGTEAVLTDGAGTTRRYALTEAFDLDKGFVNSTAGVLTRAALFAPCNGCLVMQTCRDGSAATPSTRWIFTRWMPIGR